MFFPTLRFLASLVLVVGGVTLAAPFVIRVIDLRDQPVEGTRPYPGLAIGEGIAPAHPPLYAPHTIPDPLKAAGPVAPAQPGSVVVDGALPAQAAGEQAPATPTASAPVDPLEPYVPPAPPEPIPQMAADWSAAAPPLDAAYRSTLDVPPPPLLDVAAPPAVMVGWVARAPGVPAPEVAVNQQGGLVSPAQAGAMGGPATLPASHVVRDGDDLTSIATRLYGHPGAAEAIWSANRDRLADPNLLPIGMELRLPQAWAPPATRAGPSTVSAVIEPARRPAKVRVAPGESLETLAIRYYGDRAVAGRLWEANRDQLRNPALIVPGMELRLP